MPSLSSLRKLSPFTKTSRSSSSAEAKTPEKPRQEKTHGMMGMLNGLSSRRSSGKVHPEATPRPRAESPAIAMSRPQSAPMHRQPAPQAAAPQHHAPAMPARQPAPPMRHQPAAAASRPHATPQAARPQPTERPQTRPVSNDADKLNAKLQLLEKQMVASNHMKNQLYEAMTDAETDEEYDAAARRYDAFNKERAGLIAERNKVQGRLAFLTNPTADAGVRGLMQLRASGARTSGGQADILRSNHAILERDGPLRGRRDELVAAQRAVRRALDAGKFHGVPKHEMKELEALANMDIGQKLKGLDDIALGLKNAAADIGRLGGNAAFGRHTISAAERQRLDEQARQDAQDAADNGYR